MAKKEATKTYETIVVRGIIKKAYVGKTKFSDDVKSRITIFNKEFDYSQITAYDDQPAKLTPGWFKDAEGYINLASGFGIDVQTVSGKVISFEDWITNFDTHNADVAVKIRQKEGACYPVAIKVYGDGEPVDNFADM